MWISKPYLWVIATALFVAVAILAVIDIQPEPVAQQLRIATGTEGGTYYPVGKGLAQIISRSSDAPRLNATDLPSAGTIQSIGWLTADPPQAEIAFGATSALVGISTEQRQQISLIADLYDDMVQVVVRKDSEIKSLEDLLDKRVYTGKNGSGTQAMAREVLLTMGIEVTDQMRHGSEEDGLSEVSEKLQNGTLDAAFFLAGTPTKAVKEALESGQCQLLDLEGDLEQVEKLPGFSSKYSKVQILANFYENQSATVSTIATKVRLVGRKDLAESVVTQVLGVLFDHIRELLAVHTKAQDIRFEMPETTSLVDLHPGALQFWESQEEIPLIATGTIDGLYYSTGQAIQQALDSRDVRTRVFHTDGSVDNLKLLSSGRATIALMQYDIALSAYWGGETEPIYGVAFEEGAIPKEIGIRRVAALYPEKVHILVRRDAIEGIAQPTVSDLSGLRVSLGPKNSGTQYLARTILQLHEIGVVEHYLSVRDMLNRLNAGEIDAGFFTSGVPSEAPRRVLADSGIRLLSVEPRKMAQLGTALTLTTIDEQTYGCQLPGEPPVQTIETQSVLVVHERTPAAEVREITQAIFDGVDFLGIEGGADTLARDLPSIPLHPAAKQYYIENGHLPPGRDPLEPWINFLKATWQGLAILVILGGAYKGLLRLRRDTVAQQVERKIHTVSVEASEPDSVSKLIEIKRDMTDRVKKRWWQIGEINRVRWQDLENLVNSSIVDSKDNLVRQIVKDIRTLPEESQLDSTSINDYYFQLSDRVWRHFVHGELDLVQHKHLLEVLSTTLSEQLEASGKAS